MWRQVLSKLIVIGVLVFLVYRECHSVMQFKNRDWLWHCIFGCIIIMGYAVAAVVFIAFLRYSEAVVKNNLIFYPVLVIYMIMGIASDQCSKTKEQLKHKNKSKKKHNKSKKKGDKVRYIKVMTMEAIRLICKVSCRGTEEKLVTYKNDTGVKDMNDEKKDYPDDIDWRQLNL